MFFVKPISFFYSFTAQLINKMTNFNTYKQCKSTVRYGRYRAIYVL